MNGITILENYNLFSNFVADLMKAVKDINCAFDKKSAIKDFFQTL